VAAWIASLPEGAGLGTNHQRMSYVRRMLSGLGGVSGEVVD